MYSTLSMRRFRGFNICLLFWVFGELFDCQQLFSVLLKLLIILTINQLVYKVPKIVNHR